MDNPKADNQLNLALDATEAERNKSTDLNVGYDPNNREWDLIVKYSGNLEELRPYVQAITSLLNQYAVVRILQSQIEEFVLLPQVEYVEKPKRLFFTLYQAQAVSGINTVKGAPLNLSGRGIVLACIDSGIDYRHMDFRNPDGSTRLVALWDQTISGSPPEGYFIGTEFTKEEIDRNLMSDISQNVPPLSTDISGHGTAVMGIAGGNGRESEGIYEGVAPQSDLLVVKLGTPLPDSFPRTTELIQAIDYCIRKAIERNQPLALNLSFGSSYGSREGNSLLETYLDQVSNLGRSVICVGMGNEGRSAGHTSVDLGNYTTQRSVDIELTVGGYQPSFGVQLWKNYVDEIRVQLINPTGDSTELFTGRSAADRQGAFRYTLGGTEILYYYGVPSPYSLAQELYLDFLPVGNYVDTGIWIIRVTAETIVDGTIDLYLPGGSTLNEDTRFLTPTPERTLTIPSAAANVIAVGAYDSRLNSYADFSGRGYTRETNLVKPDLAAPGVNIQTPQAGGGYTAVTGTSFATPFVTGSAALMMEWGILNGNDPYLYGEAVKANLRKGARQLPGITRWPNPRLGYGVLNLADSLPK